MGLADPTQLSRFVDKLSARSPIGAAERAALLALTGRVHRFEAHRDIVSEGERVGHASFVASGLVGSFGQTRCGLRQIIALHLAGDMANLNSVVVPEASEALQALSEVTIVQVPHADLRDIADCYPALAAAFWRESAVRNAIAAQWTVNLGRRNAASRMAHLYCEIGCRENGGDGYDGLSFGFPATQANLADMLGLTPVHVNRTLQQLREQRLIQHSRRIVTIMDWHGLANLGEFDSAYLQLGAQELRREQHRVPPTPGGNMLAAQ